jgi:hypothetical protein
MLSTLMIISVFYNVGAANRNILLLGDMDIRTSTDQLIPRGSVDPNYTVEAWVPSKTWNGTTLFGNTALGELIEVNMWGEVVWRYKIPESHTQKIPIAGVMILPGSNNVLYTIANPEHMRGAYEVNRHGELVWSFKDKRVSHDAVRLPNGNTLLTAGHSEDYSTWPYIDPQVFEVNQHGEVVWEWYAKEIYANNTKYMNIRGKDFGPWTHVNEALRLPDDSILISPRNFDIILYVARNGTLLNEFGDPCIQGCGNREKLWMPHSPIPLSNGHILISDPHNRVIEFDINRKQVVWQWPPCIGWRECSERPSNEFPLFVRGAQRLPNGNTLVTDSNGRLVEVTSDGQIVWELKSSSYIAMSPWRHPEASIPFDVRKSSFYQAERLSYMLPTFNIMEPVSNQFYNTHKIPLVVMEGLDVGKITYSLFDNSNNAWLLLNATLLENVFQDSLTPPKKNKGPEFLDIPNGEYTLRLIAGSQGFGYKEFVTPKRINYAIQEIHFFVNKPIRQIFETEFDLSKFYVSILSNSTINNFHFSQSNRLINFAIEGHHMSNGFSEVTIPSALLEGPYEVIIDETKVSHTIAVNKTHIFLYFDYVHGLKNVQIRGSNVSNPFPLLGMSFLIIIIAMFLLLVVIRRNVV